MVDLVALTVTFIINIVILELLPPRAFMFHKQILSTCILWFSISNIRGCVLSKPSAGNRATYDMGHWTREEILS